MEIALGSLASDSPLWADCDYIVSNPGKRFRVSVLENAAHYGDRPDDPLVRQSAVAIELFHAATLAHDDVVDDGKLRRGKPTVGARSGNLAASLAGAWLFSRSGELIAAVGSEAITHFAKATSVVCEGEMLESRDLYDVDRSRDRYLISIEAKTARLIALAAWMGAAIGGAAPEVVERLERYGEAIGMAFQIADDVLDVVGDPAITGKTQGGDLRRGVYTLPTIYALETDPTLRDPLLLGPEKHELPELVERIRQTGAIDIALAEVVTWTERAVEALPGNGKAGRHEEELISLATAVGARVEEMAQS